MQNKEVSGAKSRFRRVARERLRSLSRLRARRLDHRVRTTLAATIAAARAQSVMLYVPLPTEVDLCPLIRTLRRRGVRIYVPFMEGESFRLVQYRLPLQTKRYGVREPKYSKQHSKQKIDIAIVPIIGTDPTLRRVGFGQGMYDRFFARTSRRICWTIFVQRILLQSADVVTDTWDIQADAIVTGA